jgi:hypothetical protein
MGPCQEEDVKKIMIFYGDFRIELAQKARRLACFEASIIALLMPGPGIRFRFFRRDAEGHRPDLARVPSIVFGM